MDLVDIAKAYDLADVDKALFPSYSLNAVQGGHRLTRTPGLIGRKRGHKAVTGRGFVAEHVTGSSPAGWQVDQQKRALNAQRYASKRGKPGPAPTSGEQQFSANQDYRQRAELRRLWG